ncbi:MAG TPA: hypothetical protein VFQ65_33100 [Kofleriaceae bacterium]|nr:hypothetical protein [Kofleriaceae bacterium]
MNKLLLALVSSLAFVACSTSEPTAPSGPTSDGNEGVTLTVATPDRLTGSYVDARGVGITFDMASAGGDLYMDIHSATGHEIMHAETTATQYLFRYLDSRLTLQIDKAWVAQVKAEGDDGPAMKDPSAMHWTGDMAVLDEMIQMPEVRSLPYLSRALGAMGYDGMSYPSTLAMHQMAQQSAEALGIVVDPMPAADTADFCARPSANDCYGMCGPGCSCWSWVCGDCCYHSGCAKHDSWCRAGQWYYCYNITAVIALFGC